MTSSMKLVKALGEIRSLIDGHNFAEHAPMAAALREIADKAIIQERFDSQKRFIARNGIGESESSMARGLATSGRGL